MRSLANAARPFVKGEIKTWLERTNAACLAGLSTKKRSKSVPLCPATILRLSRYINDATTNLERLKNQVDASWERCRQSKDGRNRCRSALSELRTSLEGQSRDHVYRDSLTRKREL